MNRILPLPGINNNIFKNEGGSQPFCQCWVERARTPVAWKNLTPCNCGEENDIIEWRWATVNTRIMSSVVVTSEQRLVTFHPLYSSGTALVRGDKPILKDLHYYWEIKMMTNTYGTDIMVGIGTDNVNATASQFKFTSLLGSDAESYGLSYRGTVRHNGLIAHDCPGFCRGAIVGVRVDMWQGTLEFYLNRKPQGISFFNLRRHEALYPMICSTAAQSSMKLTYAASWRASLLVDAAKILAASAKTATLPPGLFDKMKSQFWLTLPSDGFIDDEARKKARGQDDAPITSRLEGIFPNPYMNGYYVDSVEPDYRVVVWQ